MFQLHDSKKYIIFNLFDTNALIPIALKVSYLPTF
jgi:hypothetical protein